jgi:hypothetical protein
MLTRIILLSVIFGMSVSAQAPEKEAPELAFFAPGVITVGAATTYRPTFTPDGKTVYSRLRCHPTTRSPSPTFAAAGGAGPKLRPSRV